MFKVDSSFLSDSVSAIRSSTFPTKSSSFASDASLGVELYIINLCKHDEGVVHIPDEDCGREGS